MGRKEGRKVEAYLEADQIRTEHSIQDLESLRKGSEDL